MDTILNLGKKYLPKALAGDIRALKGLFDARVAGWGKPYAHEEGGTVGLFSDLEQKVEPHVAFALIPAVIELAYSECSFDGLNCALDLLLSLVAASGTTELPPALVNGFPELERKAIAFGDEPVSSIAAIRRHYRNAF